MDSEANDLQLPTPVLEERDAATADYVTGLKEREALRVQLENTTRELNKVKGQNYDLLKKIDSLETQIKELKEEGKKIQRPGSGRQRKSSNLRKKPVKRKEPKKGKDGKNSLSPNSMADNSDVFENADKLYEAIAERYPDLPLATVLVAEKKFAEADVNRDGTIDANELEKILDSSDLLFTKQQILEILTKIDADETGSVDFFECLAVLDQIQTNRKTGLPQSLQRNKSTVCSIQ